PSRAVRIALALAVACAIAPEVAAAKPPPGYVVTGSGALTAPNGVQTRGIVTCPPGTVPFGGGALISSPSTGTAINSSSPTATGWTADVNNASGGAVSFFVDVVCGNRPQRYSIVTSA